MFQSTRLCEARRLPNLINKNHISFNPRACVRRDMRMASGIGLSLFQSTRLCEARPYCFFLFVFEFSFNPRACVRRDIINAD